MISNERLVSAKVYFVDDFPYLNLEYEYEDGDATHRIVFPKVEFPFATRKIPSITNFGDSGQFISSGTQSLCAFKLFNGPAAIKDENGVVLRSDVTFLDAITKKKVHEMTLEEIEKKLGYSVKIVSKENK